MKNVKSPNQRFCEEKCEKVASGQGSAQEQHALLVEDYSKMWKLSKLSWACCGPNQRQDSMAGLLFGSGFGHAAARIRSGIP